MTMIIGQMLDYLYLAGMSVFRFKSDFRLLYFGSSENCFWNFIFRV